jgi:hypothetical protein
MSRAEIQQPIDRSKDGVARRLAEAHFHVDPGLTSIYRLVAPDREASATEPIKLLEVSNETPASGVMPISFGPHMPSGIIFPSVIVEVTPEEFERIQRREMPLPHGWELGAQYHRPAGR